MLVLAKSGADDGRRHRLVFENPARGNIGNRDLVLAGDLAACDQNVLKRLPAAGSIDETLVFRTAPVGDRGGLRGTQPFVAEEAATKRAIGEQFYAGALAKLRKRTGRAAVDQREGNLVRGEGDTVGKCQGQVGGVEIGDADGADQTLVLELRHFMQGVEPGGMLEAPPMELQEIDLVDAEPVEPFLHALADHIRRHRPGFRAPFGEGQRTLSGRITRQQAAGDDLGTSVVVGHVERVETGVDISLQSVGAVFRIERRTTFLQIGHLPQPTKQAADVEPGKRRALGSC